MSHSDISKWDLPYVEDPAKNPETAPTNALNFRSGWKYEPPEKEQEIRPPTAEEIEAIRQAAYDEGRAEGKEIGYQTGLEEGKAEGLKTGLAEGKQQGYQEGFEQGQADVNKQTEQWQHLVEQLHSPLEKVDEEAKKQLTKFAVTLAKSVIQTEIQTNESLIITAVEKGIAALPINETNIQILVSEIDAERIKSHFGPDFIEQKRWDIVVSSTIQTGGCEIVSQNNAVDVSIEKRVRDVVDGFLLNHGLNDE